jgi:superfamily II DNA or RNA helicase
LNFKELDIKTSYRTPDDILNSFYIPLLSCSIRYQRAVGFFSSSVLIYISKGLTKLVKNQGKMMLITSPRLKEEDIKAIEDGYEKRNKIIERALLRDFYEPKNEEEKERLNLLSHLIADGFLDIKIAFVNNQNKMGMYHEKLGIFGDSDGNFVTFTGSLNESAHSLFSNYEAIDVFTSWDNEDSLSRVNDKKQIFEKMWNNNEKQLEIIEFPKVLKDKLDSYKQHTYDKDIDEKNKKIRLNDKLTLEAEKLKITSPNIPNCPIDLYPYQTNAINEWVKNNYRGIFDMATGTGKTYTGLGAVVNLYNYCHGNLAVVICCPYLHLIEQWVDDLKLFNIEPIIGYGKSPQKNWKESLEKAINYYNLEIENRRFFCFICSNATFSSEFVQAQIGKINKNSLFLVDEAHYFGAEKLGENLPENFTYRLALSATIDRHNDEEGTQLLHNFFGNKCIEYNIKEAIEAGALTRYNYYPLIIYLTSDEIDEYKRLTREIGKCLLKRKKNSKELPQKVKYLALQRSRLIAGADNKLIKLREIMNKYKNRRHILVYCGATTVQNTFLQESSEIDEDTDIRQINAVSQILGNDLDMKIATFTAQEDITQRNNIKAAFAKGKDLQALVAIKCLDEGFNIPEIRTAFILASTRNPKEYIQRRGRVLRLAEGKEYAEIYDFVTLPRKLDDIYNTPKEETKYDKGLVKKELDRVQEFARLAINNISIQESLIWKFADAYDLKEVDDYELI